MKPEAACIGCKIAMVEDATYERVLLANGERYFATRLHCPSCGANVLVNFAAPMQMAWANMADHIINTVDVGKKPENESRDLPEPLAG